MAGYEKDKKTLSSVTNAMQLLRLFTKKQPELSITNMAKLTGIPKSSVHRLVFILAKEGFLSKNPRTNHYRLGLSILTLGGVIFSHRELYKEGFPIVKSIAETLNESAHICLMEDEHVVYLFRAESSHPDRLLTQIGRKNPVYCTAEGLCILAYQDDKTIERTISGELYAYTPKTITNKQDIVQILSDVRDRGFCILHGSYYEHYTSIAAPIRDHTGAVVSSLSIVGHSSRLTGERAEEIALVMKNTADDISEHLGYYK
ncbi:IclR family transcriptional regulator [Domibacillus epiphyticus]|uniref:Glycerol operon regulatory protein n=1 Tax=Domibacillus epiphyticus TaxID=1714355 RepID=A0A1V2A597_9BACI|nr:IclR family transcriptional regulator [Domibacillus epiphyticus]OMP65984.1 hypothetical protein BTO28_14425 [Domibacillus epiphyticus]